MRRPSARSRRDVLRTWGCQRIRSGGDDRISIAGFTDGLLRAGTVRHDVPWNGSSRSNAGVGDQLLHRKKVASITREHTTLRPEHVGLTLGDGKTVLSALQRVVVMDQVEVEAAAWWSCPHCHQRKRIEDQRRRRLRTTFGQVEVSCRRYHRCTCRGGRPGIEWPLGEAMPTRATPEYTYLLAEVGRPDAVSAGHDLDARVAPAASI